jgi:hypothetical protein
MLSLDCTFLITPILVCTKTNKTKGVIKNVQSRDSIGHNTKNKDKQNKRGNQECTIQNVQSRDSIGVCLSLFFVLCPMLSLDCTFLITPFVLFVFVLGIVPNALSGLYILDYPHFGLFVFVLCKQRQTKQKGLSRMYNPETALATIQRTKTNKPKWG